MRKQAQKLNCLLPSQTVVNKQDSKLGLYVDSKALLLITNGLPVDNIFFNVNLVANV